MAIDFSTKRSGLLIPVFALRRTNDLGIGDTQCVVDAISWCERMGIGVLQTLPINETGGDNSPYNAISSVALDPVYITLEAKQVPRLNDSMLICFKEEIEKARKSHQTVHYSHVKQLKIKLLSLAYSVFLERDLGNKPTIAGKAFQNFRLNNQSWLASYTLFRALLEHHHGNACWTQWPETHQSPEQAKAWIQKSSTKDEFQKRIDFFAFVQWVAYTQWEAVKKVAQNANVQLMGDIPFGVSRYSADVWAERNLFDLKWSGGAPPETFFQTDPFTAKWGQNWGIPVYDWNEHAQQKYAWWKQRVKQTMRVFHLFRIDHVLGFFRIYSFPWTPERNQEFLPLTEPAAREKTGGLLPQFLPGPDEPASSAAINAAQGEKLLRLILAAAGKQGGVIAEDLGQVPHYVRPLLQKLKIPGFSIPIFEKDSKTQEFVSPMQYPQISVTTHATHDHLPIHSYHSDLVHKWHGPNGHESWLEMQRLMRLLHLCDQNPPKAFTREVHLAFLKCLFESSSWLAINQITDLLGTSQRFNEPGSLADSNWSQRLDRPLEDYYKDPHYRPILESVSQMIRQSNRCS